MIDAEFANYLSKLQKGFIAMQLFIILTYKCVLPGNIVYMGNKKNKTFYQNNKVIEHKLSRERRYLNSTFNQNKIDLTDKIPIFNRGYIFCFLKY